jgi:hypothetical protein
MEALVIALVVLAAAAYLLRRAVRVVGGDACAGCAAGSCGAATDLAAELQRALGARPEQPSPEPAADNQR